jgi:hypothetical protein
MEPYSIPRSIWESLEAVLHAKGQQLAKEIAKELNVPVQPLLAHLKTMESSKFTLVPDVEDTLYQCEGLTPHGAVLLRCKKSVFGEAPRFCSEHKGCGHVQTALIPVTRLILRGEAYILNGSSILTLEGRLCGMKKGSKIILYEVV